MFAKFDGTVVKTMGDAFLVRFESPTNAVLAAVQVHKQLERHNQSLGAGESALRVRIGIATGEVAIDDAGDVFGNAVILAAPMQSSAEPGAVWLAESTFLSMNRNEVQAFEVGARVFQGVPDEVKVYRVLDAWLHAEPALSAAGTRAGGGADRAHEQAGPAACDLVVRGDVHARWAGLVVPARRQRRTHAASAIPGRPERRGERRCVVARRDRTALPARRNG